MKSSWLKKENEHFYKSTINLNQEGEDYDVYKKEEEKKRVSLSAPAAAEPTEKVLHKNLVKLLRIYQKSLDFVFFHIKNDVGRRAGNFFYDLKPMGVLPGTADFCILSKKGVYFLEIKTLKGRLSDEQKRFLLEVNRLGYCGLVAFGWADILGKVENILLSKQSYPCTASASEYHAHPGDVIWRDETGRYLKRRPKKGVSIFLC